MSSDLPQPFGEWRRKAEANVAEKARWAREVAADAAESAASALERIEEMGSGGDRVAEWLERNARHVREVDGDLEIDLGPIDGDDNDLKVALAELRYRWGQAGLPRGRLLNAMIRYTDLDKHRQKRFANILGIRQTDLADV